MNRHSADVEGEPIVWFESGQGMPVVLVHGIPTGPSLWRSVVPLVHGARCLALEMVGYADSIPAGAGRDISVAAQAARLWRWLDAIGVERAVLVGHDLGGGVVQIAALASPQRRAGLVLVNAIGYDSWPILSVRAMRALGPVLESVPAAAFKPMLAGFVRVGHDDVQVGRGSAEMHWQPYQRHGGAAAFVRQIRSLRTRTRWPWPDG